MLEIVIGMLILPVVRYVIGHMLGGYILKKLEEQPEKYARLRVIWDHYQEHGRVPVLDCEQPTCAAL